MAESKRALSANTKVLRKNSQTSLDFEIQPCALEVGQKKIKLILKRINSGSEPAKITSKKLRNVSRKRRKSKESHVDCYKE